VKERNERPNSPVPSTSRSAVERFGCDETGQDLIEYSLLLAFIALAGAATFIGMGSTTSGIWSIVNSRLAAANQSS